MNTYSERMGSGAHKIIDATGSVYSSPVGSSRGNSVCSSKIRSKRFSDELNLIDQESIKQKRSTKFLAGLTINKLNTSNIGLIGRENEVELLHSCYNRMMMTRAQDGNHHNKRELVFIKGWSGVGKSMLVKTLETKVCSTEKGCFVEGKFDFNSSSDQPYSGIAVAFGKLFAIILKDSGQHHDLASIAKDMQEALGDDMKVMMYLIPELKELIGDHSVVTEYDVESINDEFEFQPEDAQQRWKYAFRMMARILTSIFHGLVLSLDDLQWSDVASLDVIEHLISDMDNPNPLMIVGCYRSNEVDQNSLLHKRIQTLIENCDKFHFKISEIEVRSFDVDNVNKMIMSMLSIDDAETTLDLARVCYKRTGGTPFFLLELMTLLYNEKLVEYNIGLMKWRWEASKIEEMTMSTDNVVVLLQTRMRKLEKQVQYLLLHAACLGASFRISNLELLWKEATTAKTSGGDELTVAEFLDIATHETLIESVSKSEYRWVHDNVQEAALYLSDSVDEAFRFRIGITLLYGLTPEEVEDQLFVIVDLLNTGKLNKEVEFSLLNLRAAKKARTMSAFQSASTYAANGIRFLPPASWDTHRPLALKLYAMAAEMELALGRTDSSEEYILEALSQPNLSIMESLPFQLAKARNFSAQSKFDDAINCYLLVLRQLGYKLVWSRKTVPIQSVLSLFRTKKALKRAPKEALEKFSDTKDRKESSIALVLSLMQYAAYMSEDLFLSVLCGTRLVEMTLNHGVNPFSPGAIAQLGGAILMVQQDYETCDKFGELALSLDRRLTRIGSSHTIYTAYAFGLCWTRFLSDCLSPAMEGYTLGMQKGEAEQAGWNLLQYFLFFPYAMGKATNPMLEEFPRIMAQLENMGQSAPALVLRIFWQLMLNLRGELQVPANRLEGEMFNRTKVTDEFPIYHGNLHLFEGEMLIFSSDYESVAKRAIKQGDYYEKKIPAFFMIMMETFHRGVALYAMAQKKKGLKYRARAETIRGTIRKWMKNGNPNVSYYVMFLDAEHYALTSKLEKAEEHYRKAIVFTAKTGHLHHSGLFNERYADFLLDKRKDVNEAKYRLGEAIRFYEEWGATGKVQQLKDRVDSIRL